MVVLSLRALLRKSGVTVAILFILKDGRKIRQILAILQIFVMVSI